MPPRAAKTLTVSVPPAMIEELDRVRENRTRSDVMREALHQYMAVARQMRALPSDDPEPGERDAIARGRAGIQRGKFMTLDALLRDLGSHR